MSNSLVTSAPTQPTIDAIIDAELDALAESFFVPTRATALSVHDILCPICCDQTMTTTYNHLREVVDTCAFCGYTQAGIDHSYDWDGGW